MEPKRLQVSKTPRYNLCNMGAIVNPMDPWKENTLEGQKKRIVHGKKAWPKLAQDRK